VNAAHLRSRCIASWQSCERVCQVCATFPRFGTRRPRRKSFAIQGLCRFVRACVPVGHAPWKRRRGWRGRGEPGAPLAASTAQRLSRSARAPRSWAKP
jgi:hypothetical protein